MTEPPSNTSNHQRLDEMHVHLTKVGAVIPYSVCYDSAGALWVAAKGGLYKFVNGESVPAIEKRNPFPKKMAPFCQVVSYGDQIVHVQTEDKLLLSEFRVYTLDGAVEHEQLIDGKVQSIAINAATGDIFMTKQLLAGEEESFIYKSNMSAPLGWEEHTSAFDYCFQAVCAINDVLFVAISSTPVNMYSKQALKIVGQHDGKIRSTVSSTGKADGQVFFPRDIQQHGDKVLVLDKTGRIQRFDIAGKYVDMAAAIDAYLANGFTTRGDEAILACSGIVLDDKGSTICDDWLEKISLDGSTWKREAP